MNYLTRAEIAAEDAQGNVAVIDIGPNQKAVAWHALTSAEDAHSKVEKVQPHLAGAGSQSDLERTGAVQQGLGRGRGGVVGAGEVGDLLSGHTSALGSVDATYTGVRGVVKS